MCTSKLRPVWLALLLLLLFAIPIPLLAGSGPQVFINELHYDNSGGDTGEAIEIAGPAGTDLAGWSISLYNGSASQRKVYNTIALSGVIPDQSNGYGTMAFFQSGIQNGGPDGLALVDAGDVVVQFLSYEGSFTAVDGPAAGLTSFDIGVHEASSTPAGYSLQLSGVGSSYDDFTWNAAAQNSFGSVNPNQIFSAAADTPPTVASTSPADGAAGVAVDANLVINFSESVSVTGNWFQISCANSGLHTTANTVVSGGPASYTLDPTADFAPGESCTATISAANVVDQDGAPDSMAADYQFTFTTFILVITPIHDIQGNGAASPLSGDVVTLEGVVVGDFQEGDQLSGFFVQEEDVDVDADPATSEGLFVYCGSCSTDVAVGDQVQVTGKVEERFGMTQMKATFSNDIHVQSSANPLPAPVVIDLPVTAPDVDAFYEQFEGMLVRFPDTLAVSEYFQLSRFGQIVLTEGGRPVQYTQINDPTAVGYGLYLDNLARRRIILDDENNRQNYALFNGAPVFYPRPGFSVGNYVRGGDTIANLTGVLHWSWAGFSGTDNWRIRPVTEAFGYDFARANPRSASPALVGGHLKVASFNVLNYFTTLDTGANICGPTGTDGCRGANSAVELQRQTAKIVAALTALDADVVGLMELENNGNSVAALVDALNAALGSNIYTYVDTGITGDDAIKVGMIYKTGVVAPVGTAAVLDDPAFTDPNNLGEQKNRPAVAQGFQVIDAANPNVGARFTVVVNHLKSKGSSCGAGDDDPATGQGNCNGTRTAAAAMLASWLATDPTGSGDSDTLIIGDLNAYAMEDPITALTSAGYADLADTFVGPDAYSFVFNGQIGYLDHALASSSLASQVTGFTEWHINADEVNLLDYNDTVRDPGEASFEPKPDATPLYESNAYRSSDHDPVLVGLCANSAESLEIELSQDTLWPPNHKMVTVTASPSFPADHLTVNASITSNEPDNGVGDGNTDDDAVVINGFTFQLRAERSGGGDGRVYTITFDITDACGNMAQRSAEVRVPANKGKGRHGADDAGADAAGVNSLPPENSRIFLPIITN